LTGPPSARRPAPRLVRSMVLLVTEPPFVPRALWPHTMMDAALRRAPVVIDRALDRLDITGLIIEHVSIERIVDSIDVEAVMARLDISGVATKVIDDIDLPDIIRDSTGAMASESVIGIRRQSASADDFVDRIVGHLIPGRRRARRADEPPGENRPTQ
jgi:hypothetical protein